ncbi:MAG TPA: helix-turn-helix transcriptional regulator [Casimicrobiaceae bacterium]
MDEDQLDLLFHALASQPRREMLDLLRQHPGANVGFVAAHFEISRIGVMKHLDVMEASGLIVSERSGRERRLYFNPVPLQWVYERWTDDYSGYWASRLTQLKRMIETGGAKK